MQEITVLWLGREDSLEKGSTPVFSPGEVQGLYSQWDHEKLDTTERLSLDKGRGGEHNENCNIEKWFFSFYSVPINLSNVKTKKWKEEFYDEEILNIRGWFCILYSPQIVMEV